MRFDPLPYTIIATDVAKSSSRTGDLLLRMRRDLRGMLADTLGRQGIDLSTVPVLDDGDGFRVLLPASVAPQAAVEPFVSRLGIELRDHRNAANEANRIRLRVALHHGLLHREPEGGLTGVPLKDCARLLDAPAGRELLAGDPDADLVLLVTERFFEEVVRGGGSLDPAAFRRIPVQVKETDGYAWAYLPAGRDGSPPPPPPSPPSAATGVWIIGDRHQFHGPIYGGGHAG